MTTLSTSLAVGATCNTWLASESCPPDRLSVSSASIVSSGVGSGLGPIWSPSGDWRVGL